MASRYHSAMRLDPVSLRLFVAAMEEGAIARAAEREHLAASAASRRLADLEQQLGVALFARSNRGTEPTAAAYALLDLAAPVLGTDPALVQRLRDAGERTGERAWELPLWSEALADVVGSVSDLRNTGPYGAGTIAGAAFLRHFVGEVPWAHLDIANMAWNRRDPKVGATGFSTRLLLDALRHWPTPRSAAKRRPGRT